VYAALDLAGNVGLCLNPFHGEPWVK
jgi:hypothetical protein